NVHCSNQHLRPGIHEGHPLSIHFPNVMAFRHFGWAVRKPHLFLDGEAAVEIFVIEASIFNKDKWLPSACALQHGGQCLPPPPLLAGDTTRVLCIYCPFKLCKFARPALSKIRWLRLSEQNFRVDKWRLCRG